VGRHDAARVHHQPATVRENSRQHLIDQQVFERDGRKRAVRTARDRPSAGFDEKRREVRHAESIGVAVTGAGQDDRALGGPPMVVPAVGRRLGGGVRDDADRTLRGAASRLRQLRERKVGLQDEIREAVVHGYARGFFPLDPSLAVPEPPVVRSLS